VAAAIEGREETAAEEGLPTLETKKMEGEDATKVLTRLLMMTTSTMTMMTRLHTMLKSLTGVRLREGRAMI
jgi:hypothetical protein